MKLVFVALTFLACGSAFAQITDGTYTCQDGKVVLIKGNYGFIDNVKYLAFLGPANDGVSTYMSLTIPNPGGRGYGYSYNYTNICRKD